MVGNCCIEMQMVDSCLTQVAAGGALTGTDRMGQGGHYNLVTGS